MGDKVTNKDRLTKADIEAARIKNIYKKAKKYKMEDRLTKRDVEEAENLLGKQGNPAIVETYEDARENAMINRDIPAMNTGGDVVVGKGGDYIKDLIK